MTTTDNPATPLPFLLPAANLAVGDTVRTPDFRGMIRSVVGAGLGKVKLSFVGTIRTYTCRDHMLLEVTDRYPVEVLNDVVTALTELADGWEREAVRRAELASAHELAGRTDVVGWNGWQASQLATCATEVRAILDRLQPVQPVSFDTYCAWCQQEWTKHVGGKPGVPGGPSTCPTSDGDQPECGEDGAHGGVCGQPVIDGVCPDHGEVGPPVES
jgi:hypothetical protein